MPAESIKIQFESTGTYRYEDDKFFFEARSISEDFACEYVMKILAEQSPGNPLIFRHRHPAGNDSKVIPIFGRVNKSWIALEENKRFMRSEYRVPLKAPNGKDLEENIIFAKWVEKSANESDPVGISLQYTVKYENGVAYWADIVEHTGTHYPACKDCLSVPKSEVVALEDQEKITLDSLEGKTSQELETMLEKLTLEKGELEEKIVALENDLEGAHEEKKNLEASISSEQSTRVLLEKLSKDFTVLKRKFEEQAAELVFERSDEKKLIDAIVELEGVPEFGSVYKSWTKEKLEARKKELEGKLRGLQTQTLDPNNRISTWQQQTKKMANEFTQGISGDVSPEEVLEAVDPSLKGAMADFYRKKGVLK